MLGVAVALPLRSRAVRSSASFPTNQRVDTLPVASDSGAIVRSIGLDDNVHADFGSGKWEGSPIGIPYTVVNRKTRRSRVSFDYAGETDRGRYPIPRNVKIEGGGDRHALLLDRARCRLYELYALRRRQRLERRLGRDVEPAPLQGARAAGRRPTRPACRSCRCSRRRGAGRSGTPSASPSPQPVRVHVAGAPLASDDNDPSLPRMGERLRLKASVDISALPAPGPPRRARDEDLRCDRGRQRLGLVHLGRAEPRGTTTSYTRWTALRARLRGRRHLQPQPLTGAL